MTQLNIATKEVGWGPLKICMFNLKEVLQNVTNLKSNLNQQTSRMYRMIDDLNKARQQRVVELLAAEERAICLLHKQIFRESEMGDSLVPKEKISIVRMHESWTVRRGCYDGDKTEEPHSKVYDSTMCSYCRQVLSHGSFADENYHEYRVSSFDPQPDKKVVDLYSSAIIDQVSDQYYGMPVVTEGNLASL